MQQGKVEEMNGQPSALSLEIVEFVKFKRLHIYLRSVERFVAGDSHNVTNEFKEVFEVTVIFDISYIAALH